MKKTELKYLEQRLLRERDRARRRLQAWDQAVEAQQQNHDELSADYSAELAARDLNWTLAAQISEIMGQIDDALTLLYAEPERFGGCMGCGDAIALERLDLLPWTRQCKDCAARAEAMSLLPVPPVSTARKRSSRRWSTSRGHRSRRRSPRTNHRPTATTT